MAKEELKVVSLEPVDIDSALKPGSEITETQKDSAAKTETEPEPEAKPDTEAKPNTEAKVDEEDEDEAPQPPPRPVTPRTLAKTELKLAFPGVEDNIITAVLIASQGELDPAFNALLYYSDPSTGIEIPHPVVSATGDVVNSAAVHLAAQADEDEKLARQLQQEFEREERQRQRQRRERKSQRSSGGQRSSRSDPNQRPGQRGTGYRGEEEVESPDEFDQLKETFTQGFEEARTTLNGWVSGFAKKFLDNPNEEINSNGRNQQQDSPRLFGALGGSLYNTKHTNKFDEDPEILSSDFHNRISMNDNDDDSAPTLPVRRAGTKTTTEQSDSFTDSTNKKWQPLSSEGANSDAFLVTDSEEEEENSTPKDKTTIKQGEK